MSENQHPIHLLVQYYRCSDAARQTEIDTCLQENLRNAHIAVVHVLTEEELDFEAFPNADKIRQTVIGERLSFEQAFRYANHADTAGKAVWVLSNADIWFDDTLLALQHAELKSHIFALTRHDIQSDGSLSLLPPQYAHGSQDIWIFRTPLPLDRMYTSFCLGIPGCDHRIAYEFIQAGYIVLNPSMKIIARHLDLSSGINIDERTTGYAALLTDEGFRAGNAVPPPYQYFLYPIDKLELSNVEHYRKCLELSDEIYKLKNANNTLEQLTIAQKQQLIAQDLCLNELRFEVAERDSYVTALKESLSWKITSPLRKLLAKASNMLELQPKFTKKRK